MRAPGTPLSDDQATTRLITVANRLPVTITNDGGHAVVSASVGGLASGLRSVVRGDRHWWIGWPGETAGLSPADLRDTERQLAALHTIPVSLSQQEIENAAGIGSAIRHVSELDEVGLTTGPLIF